MSRFFIGATNIFGGIAALSSDDVNHIKALRIKQGEIFTVCDGNGTDYTCSLESMENGEAVAKVISSAPTASEPCISLKLYIAFAKGDKAETVVQKAVELGADEIILFPSARCVSRPDEKSLLKKLDRYNKIAKEAAMQSGRGIIPHVSAAAGFEGAMKSAARSDLALFCYEDEKQTGIKEVMNARPEVKSVSIVTGPEGGFEPAEAKKATELGLLSVTLGSRILRCETAPLTAAAMVMYQYDLK